MNVTFGKKIIQQKYDVEFEYDTKSNAGYYNNKALFWTDTTLFVFIGLITTVGNGLVLYAAYGNKNHGPLRYLDSAIKSLALTDMLFGFIGTPLIILGYYTGNWNLRFDERILRKMIKTEKNYTYSMLLYAIICF